MCFQAPRPESWLTGSEEEKSACHPPEMGLAKLLWICSRNPNMGTVLGQLATDDRWRLLPGPNVATHSLVQIAQPLKDSKS